MPRRSPRALALWGAAAVVAVVTATVVAGDLATLHRRAADLGPEVDAVRRDARPARRPRGGERRPHDPCRAPLAAAVRRAHRPSRARGTDRGRAGARRRLPRAPQRRAAASHRARRRRPRRDARDAGGGDRRPHAAAGRRGRRARDLRPVELGHRRRHDRDRRGRDRARHRPTRQAPAPDAPVPQASPCSSTPTRLRRWPTPKPTGWSRSPWCRPKKPHTHSISRLVGAARDHPRDRPGALGVPPDLVERAPDHRPRAVRLDRAHVERLAQQDVRRRAARRHARRGARLLPARGVVLHRRRVALAAHTIDHDRRRADRVVAAASPRSRARSSARCSPA